MSISEIRGYCLLVVAIMGNCVAFYSWIYLENNISRGKIIKVILVKTGCEKMEIENFRDINKAIFERDNEMFSFQKGKIAEEFLEAFYIIGGFSDFSYEIGSVLDSYIPSPSKPYFQFALLRLHEKAIKLYTEAFILIQYGSASGAMARWRTLYEVAIVSLLLNKYPELAYKYICYSKVNNYKYAKKLVEYKDRLNLYDYNMDEWSNIEKNYEEVCKEFGWNGKQTYEWAKNEDITNPNLFELSKIVGQEHFYAYVDESHMYNHPSIHYLLNDRGSKAPSDEYQNYLFTPFELELPMQLIVCIMHNVNFACLLGYSLLDKSDEEQIERYLTANNEFPKKLITLFSKR